MTKEDFADLPLDSQVRLEPPPGGALGLQAVDNDDPQAVIAVVLPNRSVPATFVRRIHFSGQTVAQTGEVGVFLVWRDEADGAGAFLSKEWPTTGPALVRCVFLCLAALLGPKKKASHTVAGPFAIGTWRDTPLGRSVCESSTPLGSWFPAAQTCAADW